MHTRHKPSASSVAAIATLQLCQGWYECPKNAEGKRLGPLVGYAGRDEDGKQYVGDIYANIAKVEEVPHLLVSYACKLRDEIYSSPDIFNKRIHTYLGAPIGGMALAFALAQSLQLRYAFAEKKVTAVATKTSREESKLILGRHEVSKGERVAIVEDVVNNFSTTDDLIDLIVDAGAEVAVVVAALNRSKDVEGAYLSKHHGEIPVISLIRRHIPQYRQTDEAVREDIAAGNVVWKPKHEWDRLMHAMKQHSH